MKTAILCVYFGSSDTVSMDLLESKLVDAFPDCTICRAFLSRHSRGAPSMEQALAELQDHDRVLIQPMLVSRGQTYQKLLTLAGDHPVGIPLLDSPEACLKALQQWLPMPLLLMGHGSADTDVSHWTHILPETICFATMEGTPTLQEVLPLVAGHSLHLAPFLLTSGIHGTRDLALWKETLEAVGCTVTIHSEPLAHCSGIQSLFIHHIHLQMQQISQIDPGKEVASCTRD